jgi:hypothetical protein
VYLPEARRCFEAEGSYRVASAPMAQQPMEPGTTALERHPETRPRPTERHSGGEEAPWLQPSRHLFYPVTDDAPQPTERIIDISPEREPAPAVGGSSAGSANDRHGRNPSHPALR